jgi:aminopeptidase N
MVMEKVSKRNLGNFFNQWLFVAGQPDLKITTSSGKRKGFTDLIIEQTQDYLFSFDIELQVKDSTGAHIYKIPVSDRITRKTIKTENILEIIPDPNINLLFRQVGG